MAINSTSTPVPKAPASKKTEAIDLLFDRVVAKTGTDQPLVATSDDVVWAIDRRNAKHAGKEKKKLSTKNPANFLKDLIRKTTCNANWPERLKQAGMTARQLYGNERVLEFIPYRPGDTLPFPDRYDPVSGTPVFPVETLSLSRAARDLGRMDEPWLTQVLVYQRIAQFHFAVQSPLNVVELSHLQMSVKTQPEIDAVFLATLNVKGQDVRALVTCEAKRYGERILEDQIREQVAQAMSATASLQSSRHVDMIIPIAVKAVDLPSADKKKKRGIYIAEFKAISRSTFAAEYLDNLHAMPLEVAARSLFELHPSVRGISMSDSAWKVSAAEDDDDETDA